MTTTGAHSNEVLELMPTVSNHNDYKDFETKTFLTMEAEEYIFGSNCHYNGK